MSYYTNSASLITLDQIQKKLLKWWFGEDPTNWSKSETKLAVLSVILRKSRKRNQTIVASSIQDIKTGLKKHYDKDLTERQILNVTRSLARIVIKEKDPRNHRKTLYRINPSAVEEISFTLVKLDNEKTSENNGIDGILYCPLASIEKKKFLAISHKH
jgi:hypothetical protein